MPVFCLFTVGLGLYKKRPVFADFTQGAKEGILGAVKLLPTLLGLLMAIQMLKSSGFFDIFSAALRPLTTFFGVPEPILPLFLLRPLSGSGCSAYVMELLQAYGPDSEVGLMAGILSFSTETTFYVVTVYLGAAGCKKSGYCVPAALCGDAAAAVLSVALVRVFG